VKAKGSNSKKIREARVIHAERNTLQARTDRAVTLADTELGYQVSGAGSPTPNPQSLAPGFPAPVPLPPSIPRATIGEIQAKVAQGYTILFGASGTAIPSGFITDLGEYDPQIRGLQAVRVYEKMRRGDGQVRGLLNARTWPIESARWEVAPPPEEQGTGKVGSNGAGRNTANKRQESTDFCRENLFGGLEFRTVHGATVSQTFDDVLRNCLRAYTFGCSIAEIVYRVEGSRLMVARLADRQALTFYRWHTDPWILDNSLPQGKYDDGETLYALQQYGWRGGQFITPTLPADKILRVTANQEGANFWGFPDTRPMYPHQFVKAILRRLNAIACERNGMGVPVIILPPNASAEDKQTAQNFVTQLAIHEKTGLSLPNGAELKILAVEGTPREILPTIEYEDMQMARSLLAMFMQQGGGQKSGGSGGNRALMEGQTDFFMLALQLSADFVANCIRNQVLKPLIEMNFGVGAPVPMLKASNVQARGLDDIVKAISQLSTAGAWISDEGSLNQLRGELGFQALSHEDLKSGETILPGKATASVPGVGGSGQAAVGSGESAVGSRQSAVGGKPQTQSAQRADAIHLSDSSLVTRHLSLGRFRDTDSPFWHEGHPEHLRKVHAHETHIDFPEIQRAMDHTQNEIARVLRASKTAVIKPIAASTVQQHRTKTDSSAMTFGHNQALDDKLTPILAAAYRAQHALAVEEAKRAVAARQVGSRQMAERSDLPICLSADLPVLTERAGLWAEMTVQKVINQIGKSARMISASSPDETLDETAVENTLQGLSDGYMDNFAGEAARGITRVARSEAFYQIREALEAQGFHQVRICAMEPRSCDPCIKADGTEIEPGQDLSVICQGGNLCLCQPSVEPVN
jgi:hypothetical protein